MRAHTGHVARLVVLVLCCSTAAAQSDSEPPTLVDLDYDRHDVDVSRAMAFVNFRLALVDEATGVAGAACELFSPSARVEQDEAVQVSGTPASGVWHCRVTIPRYAEAGTWTVRIRAGDRAGNVRRWSREELMRLGFSADLEVASPSDRDPPALAALDLEPRTVDVTTAPAEVAFRLTLVDDRSGIGIEDASCELRSPGGSVRHGVATRTAGDSNRGVWTCAVRILQYDEAGRWTARVRAVDRAGNERDWGPPDLAALGLPAEVEVTSGFRAAAPPSARATIRPSLAVAPPLLARCSVRAYSGPTSDVGA
jgi:hypothetical protein